MPEASRSPLNVTLSVWRALFLHEALIRISGGRASWFWLLADPMVHIAFFSFIYGNVYHAVMPGMDLFLWVTVGMVTFFLFRRSAMQGMHGIDSNKAMFAYRQVKPVDTVFVRIALETFIMVLIGLIALGALWLLGRRIVPDDPLLLLAALFGVWLVALGLGLVFSVPIRLVKEADIILNFLFIPLYIASGVIIPLSRLPYQYQEWLLYNPVAHAVEAARLGFSSTYKAVTGLDLLYVYAFGVVLIFLGLLLQLRFSRRLIAQ